METQDVKLISELISKLLFLLIVLFGPKIGRFILHKYPNSVTLKIIFSDDVGKGHYYIWIIASIVLSIILVSLTHINFYIIFFVSLIIVLFIMVKYYQNRGIYLPDEIGVIPVEKKEELKKATNSGNQLNKYCTYHNDRIAMSVCSVCGKPFCYDCLWEGNDFYYCSSKECQEHFYNTSST